MFNQAEWEKYGRSMGEVSLETVPLNIQTYFTYFTCSCDKFIVCTYILHYIYIYHIYYTHIYIYIYMYTQNIISKIWVYIKTSFMYIP